MTTRNEDLIKQVKAMPQKTGRADLIKHLSGKRLTRQAAIKAKCFECVGGEDTKPCTVPTCPLKQFCQWNSSGEGSDRGGKEKDSQMASTGHLGL
ncbi:hypothetical protein FO488_03415 [Geobacter sp. FeAm09]|uniref:hypothetical protein n=1 Tax=Geobacter sp. FeAm09 TaxID=2597769 RepID=UPI0011ED2165|nr:hypothetical protein [Geobacter sp. FeAm09]QEM67293.1 hypothetical protein FO488_03415 [Geobacter sp. FeAm09]